MDRQKCLHRLCCGDIFTHCGSDVRDHLHYMSIPLAFPGGKRRLNRLHVQCGLHRRKWRSLRGVCCWHVQDSGRFGGLHRL